MPALAGVGGVLGSPWVVAAAIVVLAASVTAVIRSRRSGRTACCPPTDRPASARVDGERPH